MTPSTLARAAPDRPRLPDCAPADGVKAGVVRNGSHWALGTFRTMTAWVLIASTVAKDPTTMPAAPNFSPVPSAGPATGVPVAAGPFEG